MGNQGTKRKGGGEGKKRQGKRRGNKGGKKKRKKEKKPQSLWSFNSQPPVLNIHFWFLLHVKPTERGVPGGAQPKCSCYHQLVNNEEDNRVTKILSMITLMCIHDSTDKESIYSLS